MLSVFVNSFFYFFLFCDLYLVEGEEAGFALAGCGEGHGETVEGERRGMYQPRSPPWYALLSLQQFCDFIIVRIFEN